MTNHKRNLDSLLPERHPQMSFFVCDILDAAPKSDIASMAHPLFSLSTKPDYAIRHYQYKDLHLEIRPSAIGLATMHDRDVLIYCISQCMAALNRNEKIDRYLRVNAHDLLISTNRETNGNGYKGLRRALERLQGTQLVTNIEFGDGEVEGKGGAKSFIAEYEMTNYRDPNRPGGLEIVLSDWVFQAIREKGGNILTISRDYFRLRKPLERRLYDLARKHCGSRNKKWSMTLETLHHRSGSQSAFWEFKRMLIAIIDNQEHIPDYTFELDGDTVHFRPKQELLEAVTDTESNGTLRSLKPTTYENAKKEAKGWDVYAIEDDWKQMIEHTGTKPENMDGAFVGYVKWYVKKHGPAPRISV